MAEADSLAGVWSKIKAHPYVTSGAVFVFGAILVYWYYSGGTTAAGPVDDTAANDAAEVQSEAVQAQYAAQLSAQSTAAQSVANQINGQLALGSIVAGVSSQAITTQGSIDLAQINQQASVDLASIAAGSIVALGSLQTIGQLASITAATQNT